MDPSARLRGGQLRSLGPGRSVDPRYPDVGSPVDAAVEAQRQARARWKDSPTIDHNRFGVMSCSGGLEANATVSSAVGRGPASIQSVRISSPQISQHGGDGAGLPRRQSRGVAPRLNELDGVVSGGVHAGKLQRLSDPA